MGVPGGSTKFLEAFERASRGFKGGVQSFSRHKLLWSAIVGFRRVSGASKGILQGFQRSFSSVYHRGFRRFRWILSHHLVR